MAWIDYHPFYHVYMGLKNAFFGTFGTSPVYYICVVFAIIQPCGIVGVAFRKEMILAVNDLSSNLIGVGMDGDSIWIWRMAVWQLLEKIWLSLRFSVSFGFCSICLYRNAGKNTHNQFWVNRLIGRKYTIRCFHSRGYIASRNDSNTTDESIYISGHLRICIMLSILPVILWFGKNGGKLIKNQLNTVSEQILLSCTKLLFMLFSSSVKS